MTTKNRRNRNEWIELLEEQRKSSLTIQQFCEKHNINRSSYYQARSKFLVNKSSASSAKSNFAKIKVESEFKQLSAPIYIEYQNGTKVHFQSACIELIQACLRLGVC